MLLCAAVVLLLPACDLIFSEDDGVERIPDPLFADNTPFIAAALEASPDTHAYYHPTEVFVGSITHPQVLRYNPHADPEVLANHAIYSPTLHAQVMQFMHYANGRPLGDANAEVVITGPIGAATMQMVELTHTTGGVYVDVREELSLEPEGRYTLIVTLSDGRQYTSETSVPGLPTWVLPDTVNVPIFLDTECYEHGDWENPVRLPHYTPGNGVVLTVEQANYSHDDWLQGIAPGGFKFNDRGPYRRDGAYYGIYTEGYAPRLQAGVSWYEHTSRPIANSIHMYRRLSQLDSNLSLFYWHEFNYIGKHEHDPYFDDFNTVRLDAIFVYNDADYFFNRSNIKKMDSRGGILPESDAIGVFGSYSSIYPRLTVVPERTWDPATVTCK